MMLRLVLVGLVAALGVSIPSQQGGERWFHSAEAWATSLLAEWDTWEPSEGDEPGVVGTQGHIGCEECRLARLRLLANATKGTPTIDRSVAKLVTAKPASAATPSNSNPSPDAAKEGRSSAKAGDTVAFDPTRGDESLETEIAFELNRMSEEIVTTPTVSPAPVAASPAIVAASPAPAAARPGHCGFFPGHCGFFPGHCGYFPGHGGGFPDRPDGFPRNRGVFRSSGFVEASQLVWGCERARNLGRVIPGRARAAGGGKAGRSGRGVASRARSCRRFIHLRFRLYRECRAGQRAGRR